MNYLFLLIILLILSHSYSWYLFFDAAKILDKRLDYITRFIVDATEWIKSHSNDDD